jgi:hypothetical protein
MFDRTNLTDLDSRKLYEGDDVRDGRSRATVKETAAHEVVLRYADGDTIRLMKNRIAWDHEDERMVVV